MLLLLASACLAQPRFDRFIGTTTNGIAYVAATRAHYELVPENVPLPTGQTQKVVTMRRMLVSTVPYTNHPIVLSLVATPPFTVEISTNLLSWTYFDASTNKVYTFEVCPQQQGIVTNAFFRAVPLSQITRILRP